jgi:septal ring factor EnvC (AmiA/AmiB activator)
MSEFPNDIVIEHGNKIAKLETDVQNVKNQLNDWSDIKNAVVELKVLQQEQVKSNKKFEKLYEETTKSNMEITSTLKGINENLNSLNTKTNSLEEKIDEIDERSKIDILKMAKDWIPKLIIGGIAYYILQIAGIIKL